MKHFLASLSLALTASVALPAFAGMDEATSAYDAGQFETAYQEFEILAGEGHGEAAFYLGRMHEFGEGVAQNFSQALNWYRIAADNGHAEAYFAMGQMYDKGVGSPQDFKRAFESYQAGSDLGHAGATKRLAMMHAEGRGTMVDYAEAARLLEGLAGQGDEEASQLLAFLMESGNVPMATTADADDMAAAEPTTDVERVRQGLEEILRSIDMGDQPNAEADLIWNMDVTEASDGTITIDIADLLLEGEDAAWELGDTRAVMTPVGESLYATVLEVPTETIFFDGVGTEIGGTAIGNQRFDGIYHMDFGNLVKLDAAYDNIAINAQPPGEPPLDLTIESITAVMDMEETAPGKWSGPNRGELAALVAEVGKEGGMTMDRLWYETDTQGADLAFFRTFQQTMERLQAELDPNQKNVDEKVLAQTIQDAFGELRTLLAQHEPVIQGFDMAMGIQGTEVTDETGAVQFGADEMAYGFGFAGLDQPLSSMKFDYSHSGLVAAADEDVPDAYLPRTLELAIELDKLPIEEALTMGLEMAEGAAADPNAFEEQMDMAFMFMMMGMQQRLVASGTVVRINAFNYASDALDATMSGEVTASADSPYGAVGQIDLQITGLDTAVQDLYEAEKGTDAQDMAMALAMMQSVGTRTEVDGRSVHDYAFDFTPEGRVLLNGNDMEPLIGGMMGGGQP